MYASNMLYALLIATRHTICLAISSFLVPLTSGVTINFVRGGVQQIQLRTEESEQGSGGGSPLVRGSGGSCNLVQEISFHIVKFS